jgi:hypothetical protein
LKTVVKGTRVKSGGEGGKTPIAGAPQRANALMSKTRQTARASQMPRKNDPQGKRNHLGMKIGARVTSRETK